MKVFFINFWISSGQLVLFCLCSITFCLPNWVFYGERHIFPNPSYTGVSCIFSECLHLWSLPQWKIFSSNKWMNFFLLYFVFKAAWNSIYLCILEQCKNSLQNIFLEKHTYLKFQFKNQCSFISENISENECALMDTKLEK